MLRDAGLPVTDEPRAAIRALAGLGRLATLEAASSPSTLTGPIESWGLPLVEGEIAPDGAAAVEIAERLGYPVAVKLVSPGLDHKTEVGGVVLDLRDVAAVRMAFDQVVDAARAEGLAVNGVRVERYRPGLEMIVGGILDPVFGLLVSVGIGGVLTEVLGDVVFAPAPVGEPEAAGMIDRLQGRDVLDGFRGAPAADIPGLARIVSLVSRGLVGSGLREVDLNPLIWDGEEWIAVDWLVVAATVEYL
jgi:hypothetical protein